MRLMYINGEFTKGSATEAIEVTNPATEEVLDTVPRGRAEDVEAAVDDDLVASRRVLVGVRAVTGQRRSGSQDGRDHQGDRS